MHSGGTVSLPLISLCRTLTLCARTLCAHIQPHQAEGCRPHAGFLLLLLLSLGCWQACPTPAVGAEAPLTLARAQQLALARSRQLDAFALAAQSAREMAVAAGQLPDPILKAGIDNVPTSGPERLSTGADFMTMRRIGLMQEWTS